MAPRVIRCTSLSAAALLLAALPAATPAEAAGNGTATTTLGGVPSRVATGDGFTLSFTVKSTSPYRIQVDTLYLSFWNRTERDAGHRGVDAQWQDPATGAWRASDFSDGMGWSLYERGAATIQPYGSLTVHVRIAMGPSAPAGTYQVGTNGVSAYSLVDQDGHGAGSLDSYNYPQTTFVYGGGAAPATPTRTTAAPSRTAIAGHSSSPVADDTAARASATADAPSPVDSPTPAPSPSETPSSSPTASGSPSPSVSASTTALSTTGGSGSAATPLALGAGAVLAGGAALVVAVRRRRTGPSQDAG
ncbi:hypothetical protein AB0K51_00840 [Kitasatospora sp. NPDC049285]|uniref:hypothetical protein n=1 Tax=Kitasatospora sp. NPDC049285 TaxID=3157096 RepID=UPI00343D301A